MTNNLIARPGIKTVKELRKKILGVQSIGGTNWIGAMLWLENLGLEPQRDHITILATGDQTVRAQALESGNIDAAAVDLVFSRKLEQRGFTVLGDSNAHIPFVGVDLAATRTFLAEQPGAVEMSSRHSWKAWHILLPQKTMRRYYSRAQNLGSCSSGGRLPRPSQNNVTKTVPGR